MYVVSNAVRIYFSFFLLLCLALFSTATLAADGYWSTQERRFIPQSEVNRKVQRILDSSVKKPSGSTLGVSPSAPSFPTVSKNPAGGLSATTQNTIKTLGKSSSFNSTLNNSVSSARTALSSCVRSPACATRVLGTAGILYEGIQGWKTVHGLILGDSGNVLVETSEPVTAPPTTSDGVMCELAGVGNFTSCEAGFHHYNQRCQVDVDDRPWICPIYVEPKSYGFNIKRSDGGTATTLYYISNSCPSGSIYSYYGCSTSELKKEPLTNEYLDNAVQTYLPVVSDAPIVLHSGSPESITLSTPAPAELPSTTTTSTDSLGQTTTSVTNNTINYNITSNNTSSPSINSSIVENTTVYDSTSNIVGTSTSTTTDNGVQSDVPPPSSSPIIDFELPSFCSWASIVCDWIGWTQEELGEEELDLTVLISEFEPDEDEFSLGIGAGTCPSSIQLNITFINKTVEVSYQPFCDFVTMIRPFILAAAYLFAAYLYIGVLKRG